MPSAHIFEELAIAEPQALTSRLTYTVRAGRSLRLIPSQGAVWIPEDADIDLGYPEVRDVTYPLPDDSGGLDFTHLFGSREVAIPILVLDDAFGDVRQVESDVAFNPNSAAQIMSFIGGFMDPKKTVILYYKLRGQEPRFMVLRPADGTMSFPGDVRDSMETLLQFRCPSGRVYSYNEEALDGNFSKVVPLDEEESDPADTGFAFPIDFNAGPLQFPPDTDARTIIDYTGSVASGFIARITARTTDLSDPRLRVTDSDGTTYEVGFEGLDIPQDSYLTIDTINREVFNGDDRSSRANTSLQAPLSWPILTPGVNQIQLTATLSGAGSEVEILWWPSHLM